MTERGASTHGTGICGCCAGLQARTPAEVVNRLGLPAVAYRVGAYAQFRPSLLAGLSDSQRLALAQLTTREGDDFSIALLDVWAMVADVLTFYQERIANESYLRTATEPLSMVELVRALGYELAPGVAAHTYLAFAVDDSPGAPGYATIDVGTKVQSVPGPGETPQTFETVEQIDAKADWNELRAQQKGPQTLSVDMCEVVVQGAELGLKPGDMLLISVSNRQAMRRIDAVDVRRTADETCVTLEKTNLQPGEHCSKEDGVWALRVTTAPFGHNAPLKMRFVRETKDGIETEFVDSAEWPLEDGDKASDVVHLDGLYDRVQADDWIVMDRPSELGDGRFIARVKRRESVYRASYGLGGQVAKLTLDTAWFEPQSLPETVNLAALRQVAIYTQSELLDLVPVALPGTIAGKEIPLDKPCDDLEKGRTVLVTGEDATGARVGESAVLAKASAGNPTVLALTKDLQFTYTRASVRIHANVAGATHGETRREVLGSGEAGRAFQRFALRHAPLTYVSADVPGGVASTLEVRVNDVLWQEAPTLHQRGPRDRVYITRRDSEAKTTVQFGDGRAGARPATGQENIKAVYREGLGHAGMVKADQLSLLMTRPLGVKGVTNPRPPAGAKDPEDMAQARRNAPRTVLTLGRIVSLEDYADFASGFAGIAKALATWIWYGDARGVLVTAAADEGDHLVPEGSDLHGKLLSAMRKAGDPRVPIKLASYRWALFALTAGVQVDSPTYEVDKVLAAVRSALQARFSFEARDFGQGVALSEVVAVIQDVPGVVMVDVSRLCRTEESGRSPFLTADTPSPGEHADKVQGAELLTLDSTSLDDVEAVS